MMTVSDKLKVKLVEKDKRIGAVLVFEPGKFPRHEFVDLDSLEDLQKIVGGYIECVPVAKFADGRRITLVCNEDGRSAGGAYVYVLLNECGGDDEPQFLIITVDRLQSDPFAKDVVLGDCEKVTGVSNIHKIFGTFFLVADRPEDEDFVVMDADEMAEVLRAVFW